MSPLNIEILNPERNEWIKFGTLFPGDLPGSISDTREDGKRDIYLFECKKDDKKSIIYRSKKGFDLEKDAARVVFHKGLEKVAEITDGKSHELTIRSRVLGEQVTVRFLHNRQKP